MTLDIRKMRKSDFEPLYLLLSDPEVMMYLESPYTQEKTKLFLETCGLTAEPRIYAVDNDEGFAGYVIFHEYDRDSLEIGWGTVPEILGTGLCFRTDSTAC